MKLDDANPIDMTIGEILGKMDEAHAQGISFATSGDGGFGVLVVRSKLAYDVAVAAVAAVSTGAASGRTMEEVSSMPMEDPMKVVPEGVKVVKEPQDGFTAALDAARRDLGNVKH